VSLIESSSFAGMFGGRAGRGTGLRSKSVNELRAMRRDANKDIVLTRKDMTKPAWRTPYQQQSLQHFIDQQERLIGAIERALAARAAQGEMDGLEGIRSYIKSVPTRVANIIKRKGARELKMLNIGLTMALNPAMAANPVLWKQAIQVPEFIEVGRELLGSDPTPAKWAEIAPGLDPAIVKSAFNKAIVKGSK